MSEFEHRGVFPPSALALRFERALARPAVRLAAGLLYFLLGVAIGAPFLAHDRPLSLTGYDFKGYSSALLELPILGANLEQELDQVAPANPAAPDAWRRAQEELRGVDLRVRMLEFYAAEPVPQALTELRASVRALAQSMHQRAEARAQALAQEFTAGAAAAQSALAAANPRLASAPGATALRPRSLSPVSGGLAWWERCLLVGWCLTPLVFAVRRWLSAAAVEARWLALRRPAAWLGVGALLALAWSLAARPSPPLAPRDFKQALARGDFVASAVRFAPIPFGPAEQGLSQALRAPSWALVPSNGQGLPAPRVAQRDGHALAPRDGAPLARHWLGTDSLGRDLLARLVWGTRTSLGTALLATTCLILIGTALGACAAWFGGKLDWAVSRLIEVLLGVPAVFLVVLFASLCPRDVVPPWIAIVLVLAASGWTGVARLVRGELLLLRREPYVESAALLGASPLRTLFVHALPGALAPVLVSAGFAVSGAILLESAASFLGFGIAEPVPSWGALIRSSADLDHWWLVLFPGLAICLTVICTNALSESLRDALHRD